MGSMLDLLGSYIIGGLVLILMGAMLLGFQDTTRDALMNEISQISLAERSQTMERELTNMGYRVPGNDKIVSLSNQGITFLSDFDNNGEVDTISYVMNEVNGGPVITRTISRSGASDLTWTTRGSMVLFTGYDENGSVTFNPTDIRAIEASMLTSNLLFEKIQDGTTLTSAGTANRTTKTTLAIDQSTLLTTAVDCETGAYWHKVLYPRNLTVEPPVLEIAEATTGSSSISAGEGSTTTTDPGNTGSATTTTTNPGTTATDPGPTATDPGTTDTGETVIVPPSNKNNPCPCGSGLSYRNCHGL